MIQGVMVKRFACLVALGSVVAGCGGGSSSQLSLRAVEKAFYEAKIPFAGDWQRAPTNPYVTGPNGLTAEFPPRFGRRITGWADFTDPRTFVTRVALVFDDSTSATAFARWF